MRTLLVICSLMLTHPALAQEILVSTNSETRTNLIEEAWEFKGDDGNSMEIQLQFVRGLPARSKAEARVFSADKPEFYRIYRIELASDLARSTATGSDRVNKISVKAAGPKIPSLFNGTEQQISVTSVPWYWRQTYRTQPISRHHNEPRQCSLCVCFNKLLSPSGLCYGNCQNRNSGRSDEY